MLAIMSASLSYMALKLMKFEDNPPYLFKCFVSIFVFHK